MPELNIEFDSTQHRYLVNGELPKISVTVLIEQQVEKTDWAGINPAILQAAADRGTLVHADLEQIVGSGAEPTTQEGRSFLEYVKEHNWVIEEPRCEFKLAIDFSTVVNNRKCRCLLAGTADLMCKLNGKRIVVDHKTTSVVHEQYVRWQTSLLDYMARHLDGWTINGEVFHYEPAEEFYCFHYDKKGTFTPIKVEKISDIEIERLLTAEAADQEYHPTVHDILTPRQQEALIDIERKLCAIEAAKALLAKEEATIRAEMEQAFRVHTDVTSVTFGKVTISYTQPSTRATFDATKFKADHPDLYEKYLKTSAVKDSVTIKLAKEEQDYISARAPEIPLLSPPQPVKKNTKKRGYFQ